jgi:hypothetical protein
VLGLLVSGAIPVLRHQVVLEDEATTSLSTQVDPLAAASFLQHDTTGHILIDVVQNELVAFPVLDRTVYSGTRNSSGNVWVRALKDPQAQDVSVIVMRTTPGDVDAVYQALHSSPRLAAYHEVYHNGSYVVYELDTPKK